MDTGNAKLDGLLDVWRTRVFRSSRRAWWAWLVFSGVMSAQLGYFGLWRHRVAAWAALALIVAVGLLIRTRRRRWLCDPAMSVRAVLSSIDREVRAKVLRAVRLKTQGNANDSSREDARAVRHGSSDLPFSVQPGATGSPGLAALHLHQVMEGVSYASVEASADRRRLFWRLQTWALAVAAVLIVVVVPYRTLLGWDIMLSVGGRAPVPVGWFEWMRVSSAAPAYLKLPKRLLLAPSDFVQPVDSTVVVWGVPKYSNLPFELTDGTARVPFISDGEGGMAARWVLEQSASLWVVARFGDVAVRQPGVLHLEAVPDRHPQVELQGAPGRYELSTFAQLALRYRAGDDYGLEEIVLVFRSGELEARRQLASLNGASQSESGAIALLAEDPFLRKAFEPVEVTIEARDNRPTGDVQWGRSLPITIVPPHVGRASAERFEALVSVRTSLVDTLAGGLKSSREKRRFGWDRQISSVNRQVVDVLNADYGTTRIPKGMSNFFVAQLGRLKASLAPESRIAETEEVVLAMDAALQRLATREAQEVAGRLATVAEALVIATRRQLEGGESGEGFRRLIGLADTLVHGSRALSRLGDLGRDIGTVAQANMMRIERAFESARLEEVEAIADHLAQRLRRPKPSFGSARGGGVESGDDGDRASEQPNPSEPASDADRRFDELASELAQLAMEHRAGVEEVERHLSEEANRQVLGDQESEGRGGATGARLREVLAALPRSSRHLESPGASGALSREQGETMLRELELGNLERAMSSGKAALRAVTEARRRSASWSRYEGRLSDDVMDRAKQALEEVIQHTEAARLQSRQISRRRLKERLIDSAEREDFLAKRSQELANKGAQGPGVLSPDMIKKLREAERLMQLAARDLAHGDGATGYRFQEQAQELLERADQGKTSDPSQPTRDAQPRRAPRSDGDVPEDSDERTAEAFRRRVLEGLNQPGEKRLTPALKRYAESLLK